MSVVTLAYVKAHLNIPSGSTTNDAELQGVIDAAEGMAADLVGPIAQVTVTETHDGGGHAIVLRVQPVISVTSVTERTGQTTYTDTLDTTAGYATYGYQLDDYLLTKQTSGFPSRFFAGRRNVTVVYQAGRSSLTSKQQYAIADLVKHLWQSQQGSRMNAQSEDWSQVPFAIPNRVREAFGKDLLLPGIA